METEKEEISTVQMLEDAKIIPVLDDFPESLDLNCPQISRLLVVALQNARLP